MTREELIALFEKQIEIRGASAREIARQAGFDLNIIKNFRRNRSSGKVTVPSFENLQALCAALGLDFYIGPPRGNGPAAAPDQWSREVAPLDSVAPDLAPDVRRDIQESAQSLIRAVLAVGGDPIPDDLWPLLLERRGAASLPQSDDVAAAAQFHEEVEPEPSVRVFNASSDKEMAQVEVDYDKVIVPFAKDNLAAAGAGAWVYDNEEDMRVAVPRSFLPGWASSRSLTCVRASGDSMEPEINDGDLILLDQSSLDPIDGEVFVICSEDCLVVKRVRKTDDGWQMTSDNPAYKSRPLGEWDRNVGRVAWSGPLPATEAGG